MCIQPGFMANSHSGVCSPSICLLRKKRRDVKMTEETEIAKTREC